MSPPEDHLRHPAIPTDRLSPYLHAAFFLTGVGVLMLGPLLPEFSQQWRLQDSQVGMLLTAQFAGSFTGAVLLHNNLKKSLTIGNVCLAIGYTALALAAGHSAGFVAACVALLVGGFGIGQLINAISLISARRAREKRGAALMSLNLTWSAGALLSPLLIGLARGHLSLQPVLFIFAATAALLMLYQFTLSASLSKTATHDSIFLTPLTGPPSSARSLLLYFAFLFFLYGALENSITGWLATFTIRYAHGTVSAGAYVTTVLWIGITAGRAVALPLLRRLSERTIQVAAILATILASLAMYTVSSQLPLLILAVTLGASLAPIIPVTQSLFLGSTHSTPRQAGFVMATAALGGATLPLLIGFVSQHFGSLRYALELPSAVGVSLLLLCLYIPKR